MMPVRQIAGLALLALLVAGCSYGYTAPYSRYGTGPEITLAPPGAR